MRDSISIIMSENSDGTISFQASENSDSLKGGFDQVVGTPGDPESRLTFISLDFTSESAEFSHKVLPQRPAPPVQAVRLGEGPISLDDME